METSSSRQHRPRTRTNSQRPAMQTQDVPKFTADKIPALWREDRHELHLIQEVVYDWCLLGKGKTIFSKRVSHPACAILQSRSHRQEVVSHTKQKIVCMCVACFLFSSVFVCVCAFVYVCKSVIFVCLIWLFLRNTERTHSLVVSRCWWSGWTW